MDLLTQLAHQYGTDKAGHYTPLYNALLWYKRDYVRRVLEIGIGTVQSMQHVPNYQPGASLRMWRDYFPSATVYGVDKDVTAMVYDEQRIYSIHADQTLLVHMEPVIREFAPFDLIVDDGSHVPQHQTDTFKLLYRYLTQDGLYIIEDVNDVRGVAYNLPSSSIIIGTSPDEAKQTPRAIICFGGQDAQH